MFNKAINIKIFNLVTTISVLLALIFLSIIQYHWVTSSAEKDLSELYRSFSFRIFSVISEEFSMFPLMGKPMEFLKDIENEEELQDVVKELFNTFKTDDSFNYIDSISYLEMTKTEKLFMNYSENGWNDQLPLPQEFSINERGPSLIPDINDKNKVWINLPVKLLSDQTQVHILFAFDILSFYKNEIESSLRTNEGVYELKWYYDLSEVNKDVNVMRYQYSPFRVLKNKILSRETPWFIEIPLHVIMFNEIDDRRSKIFFEPNKRDESDREAQPSVYVDIYDNGKPLIQSKEYNLTLQWLLSLSLLLGIGIAYLIILYQINRLKQLRMREKEFVASVTHELRTPLTVINSAADNIKSGIISPDRIEKYGHLITDQSVRLSSMIEGILLFSRLEGKAEQSPILREVTFHQLKKDLEIFIQSITQDKNIKVEIDFGSLPSGSLTDLETIELVLTNLISNSIKHAYGVNEAGEVRVKGHIQLPKTLVFTVEDDGTGINKKEKKQIFDPFFRGDKSFKNQIKGSGLGLYLSFRKTRLLSGTLKVYSPYERADGRLRKGSRFTLSLPYIELKKESSSV